MPNTTESCRTVYFARLATGVVAPLAVPALPVVADMASAMHAEFAAQAIASGRSVRLQYTELLDEALDLPDTDLDCARASCALGLLRLHGATSLLVVDHGDRYEYIPVVDDHAASKELRRLGRRLAHPRARPAAV